MTQYQTSVLRYGTTMAGICGCLLLLGCQGKDSTEVAAESASGIDLDRASYHFASCGITGDDLSKFEEAINADQTVCSCVANKEHVSVTKAEDGSIVGYVDRNKSGSFDSSYSLKESSSVAQDAKADDEEIVFRIRHETEKNTLVFSDREHRHTSYTIEGNEFGGSVPITNWMSTKQHAYYGEYWKAPETWEVNNTTHNTSTTTNITNKSVRTNSTGSRSGSGSTTGGGK